MNPINTNDMKKDEKSLPFSEEKQRSLLKHLLTNDQLFMACRNVVEPNWFLNLRVNRIWHYAKSFGIKYGRKPSINELKEWPELILTDEGQSLATEISIITLGAEEFGVAPLIDELDKWLHAKFFQDYVEKSITLYEKQKFDEAYQEIRELVRKIQTTSTKPSKRISWENPIELLKKQREILDNGLTFGLTAMDRLLLPDSKGGGLVPGDLTVILAPLNVGKTSCVTTVTTANVKRGKHVLVITHEGREDDLYQKIWRSMLELKNIQEVTDFFDKNPSKGLSLSRIMNERITYLNINKGGLTIEEVEGIVRRETEDHVARYGRGFDLFVHDSPGNVISAIARGGAWQRRQIDEYVYNYLTQMAGEFKFHILTTHQVNREGGKINLKRKGSEDRLLDWADAHESIGGAQKATNVITLNRSPEQEARQLLLYYLCKSRSSETGWTVVAKTNYQNCITHSDRLGCVYYKGNRTDEEKIETLFSQLSKPEVIDGQA